MRRIFLWICRILNWLVLKKCGCTFGSNVCINGILGVSNKGKIKLGNNSTFNSGFYINPVFGSRRTTLVTCPQGEIVIGNHCGISNTLIYARSSVVIEDYVSIGGGCTICDTDFHPLEFNLRKVNDQESVVCKPVRIKEGAFIGMNCIILKGVTIGKQSIVGAGSVVTSSIPDNEIWGGNPARLIRKL